MLYPTLVHEYLTRSAALFPEKTSVVCEDQRCTYGALDAASSALAESLMNMGLKRRDRAVVFLDNSIETVISLYGILKTGGTFVLLDASMKSAKLRYILDDSEAAILITHRAKAGVVLEALEGQSVNRGVVWVDGEVGTIPGFPSYSWDKLISPHNFQQERTKFAHPTSGCIDMDLAALIYTSGSTGEPKGVMSSHRNMVSAGQSIIRYLEKTRRDIIISVLPLSFDYGLYQVLMSVMVGATVILEKSFLYPVQVLERIRLERVTGFPLVPTIAAFLLKLRNLSRFDLSSLRYVTNTAAALPVDHIRKLRELLPGVKLYSMYGLTECKRVSYLPPDELERRPSSVGRAMPNTEVLILDKDGNEAPPGVVGELVVRGSHVTCGYWKAPDLTAATFRPNGPTGERLLYSGDYFMKDQEGFLYFVGRKDDMIKTKGERVSPREIENVLCGMERVLEAAVFGVDDQLLGQTVAAFLVCEEPCPSPREVMKYCSSKLQPFMVPRHIEFVQALPKTANGKVDKKALKSGYRPEIEQRIFVDSS